MKNQQQLAKELFFQQGMSKTAIAEKLGISRRTIYQWSVDGDWETLRQHARTMPLMLTERVYYIVDLLTNQMLTAQESIAPTITTQQVNMLAKLTNIICKLRKGSTVNEDMETFQIFMDRVFTAEESLAEEIKPHVEAYISDRTRLSKDQLILAGFNRNGTLPVEYDKLFEQGEDEADMKKMKEELAAQPSTAEAFSAKEVAKEVVNEPKPTQQSSSTFRGLVNEAGSKREVPTNVRVSPAETPKPAAKHIFNHLKPQTQQKKPNLAAA